MEPSTLQSLQQLIQWTADLALNILARLPEQYKSPIVSIKHIIIIFVILQGFIYVT